jgi:hypothetical protein
MIMYQFITIPYYAAFHSGTFKTSGVTALDYVCDVFFLLDIFIKSRTVIEKYGVLIEDPTEIRSIYFHSKSIRLDIFSVLPFEFLTFAIFKASGIWTVRS